MSVSSNTRLLLTNDIAEIYEVLKVHNSISRMEFLETINVFSKKMIESFDDPNFRAIGYYEDNVLVTFLFQYLSSQIPAWHMTLLGTRSLHKWNYSKNGLDDCWSNAMHYAEDKSMYRIYWALPERWSRSARKTMLTSIVWPRYEIYIEDVIGAGKLPKWAEHKPAFGKLLKPHNTVIKCGILKNEYRKFNRQS